MTLGELLDLMADYDVQVDIYTTTESEWHKTLYEGYAFHCPEELNGQEVLGIYDYEQGICIGIANWED